MRKFFIACVLFNLGVVLHSQVYELPVPTDLYSFIDYKNDQFIFCNGDSVYQSVYTTLDSIIMYGEGKLNIVHIGGSHIQADMYTQKVREYFQNLCLDCNGGRGLVTPYKIAHTNNPLNYTVKYNGDWEYSNIVNSKSNEIYGISGLTLYKKSKEASIFIDPNHKDSARYKFNKVQVFHNACKNLNIWPKNSQTECFIETDSVHNVTTLFFDKDIMQVELSFTTNEPVSDSFFLYGILLESDDPGIVYNTIGINGASFKSFLKADLMIRHMGMLKPDLCIISVGTNDGNSRYFKPDEYYKNYALFIQKIQRACPETRFLLTVPNDSKLFGKYSNTNTELIKKVILQLGCDYNCAVWDFYSVMGGLNSIEKWYNYGLARPDFIHFNEMGYDLKGDLLFIAFLRAYDKHRQSVEKNTNEF